ERIVRSAIRVFSRMGMNRATFQAVADDAGINQTAIFRHFADKEALIEGALVAIVMSNRAIVESAADPRDDARTRLHKYGELNFRWAVEKRHEAEIISMLYYLATVDPRFAA